MFLETPEVTDDVRKFLDEDIDEYGYVMNVSKLWAYQPASQIMLFDLMRQVISVDRLSFRERAILVTACATAFGDSYCALAQAKKLAGVSDGKTAAGVITGTDEGLTDSERAMAEWARKVARDPSGATEEDVELLRKAGFSDSQIFTITAFVSLRLAFMIVNDALGALADVELRTLAPPEVVEAVTFGRPIASE